MGRKAQLEIPGWSQAGPFPYGGGDDGAGRDSEGKDIFHGMARGTLNQSNRQLCYRGGHIQPSKPKQHQLHC